MRHSRSTNGDTRSVEIFRSTLFRFQKTYCFALLQVYVGAALVQRNLKEPSVLVGIDDCKIEWSDKLASQVPPPFLPLFNDLFH